ncbi:IST1 -like protein [Sarcoptes scabiei]|nr:IST1 -like protein [Sarcoptes scabiei]KPM05908.1 IST1-like protein [Sarcoptes scabiei]
MTINYSKLKTNLSLAIQRLKLMERKKTESVQKSRKEVADYLENGKVERARIRVEHIIREDYLIEAMEIVEMFCDLLLARFGMIQQMKTLDDGLEEAISSLIWVAPRMSTVIQELAIIADIFTQKYGKQFAQASKDNTLKSINEKLMLKLGVQAPPKILVEKYLIEIAKIFGVDYEPDAEVMREDEKYQEGKNFKGGSDGGTPAPPGLLIDLKNPNAPIESPSDQPPPLPLMPPSGSMMDSDYLRKQYSGQRPPEIGFIDLPPQDAIIDSSTSVPPSYEAAVSNISVSPPDNSSQSKNLNIVNLDNFPSVPNLPDIPSDNDDIDGKKSTNFAANDSNQTNDEADFDDLRRRFEDLKKRN